MQAVEITSFGGPEVLRLGERPAPVAGAGELLIRVAASGINRPDVLQRLGHYAPPPGTSDLPGLEVAGVVESGDASAMAEAGIRVGDRVCALVAGGGYAQWCVAPVVQCLPVPEGFSDVEAASLPETFFTVWSNVFDRARLQPGESLLVTGGTSGIGTTALMLCQEFGIQALATAGSADKCAAIAKLGAEPINYREQAFAEVIAKQTDGKGVNVILDIMGASYLNNNLKALGMDGHLVILGFLGGAKANDVDLLTILGKRAVITGSLLRARTREEKAEIAEQLREHVWPLLSAGRCLPMIDQVYAYTDAAQAHARMEGGDHIGKIVLRVE